MANKHTPRPKQSIDPLLQQRLQQLNSRRPGAPLPPPEATARPGAQARPGSQARPGTKAAAARPTKRTKPAKASAERMVKCAGCGLHLPLTEALPGSDDRFFCSEAHRQHAAGS